MRLDRTVSLYAFRPLMEMKVISNRSALPILMYHSISNDMESDVSPYYRTSTTPALFAQHMRWLKDEGFRSIGLEEGVWMIKQKNFGMEKFVVITFDDAFRNFYDTAFPVLKEHGYTATVFLPTAFIRQNRGSFNNKECLTWEEVRELHGYGIQFGSHTVNHPILYESSWKEIEYQLAFSKTKLEQELGQKNTGFAYPFAFPQQDQRFVNAFKRLLQEQGYQCCLTTMVGRVQAGDDLFTLKRLPINNCDDKPLLLAKLNGAYDWLAYPQSWFKSACHRFVGTFRKEVDLYPIKQLP